jgi:hypothetical protein
MKRERRPVFPKAPQAPQSGLPKSSLDTGLNFRLKFSSKNILHFLKMLVKGSQFGFWIGSVCLLFAEVPLGRFYSSRPSSRSQNEIVPE